MRRLQSVMEKWTLPEKKAKLGLMKNGMCSKQHYQSMKETSGDVEVLLEVSKVEANLKKWCGDRMPLLPFNVTRVSSMSWRSIVSRKKMPR
mmetsp:Transcript_16238/g.34312  ORF Transcript_16238/g.34312 Transcript_16238/m.34312 type:complete len:91 (-) Transcript_16238:236-508(-)